MHIGIVCPPVPGHLLPMSAIGRGLQNRGHKVTLFGISDLHSHAEKESLNFEPIGIDEFPKGALNQYLDLIRDVDLTTIVAGIKWAKKMSMTICHDVSNAIKKLQINALLVDQAQYEGSTIAEVTGIPFISICNALDLEGDPSGNIPPAFVTWSYANGNPLKQIRNRLGYKVFELMMKPVVKTIDAYRVSHGLAPCLRWDRSISNLAVICNMTPSLNYNRRERKRLFYYTGPYLDENRAPVPFPYDRLDGRPIVYASLGTIHTGKEKLYRQIAEACLGLSVQLVMSMGGWRIQGPVPDFLGNPVVVPFAPQLDILRRAAVVITHAGANTVMEALAHACPIIAIPITSDQPAIASRITWAGVGKGISLKEISPYRIRSEIEEILYNQGYRERAQAIQTEIQEIGGLKKAIDIIEDALNPQK